MESHIDIAVQALHDKQIQTIVATARLYNVPPTQSRFRTLLWQESLDPDSDS
jgi:hypothetical protein